MSRRRGRQHHHCQDGGCWHPAQPRPGAAAGRPSWPRPTAGRGPRRIAGGPRHGRRGQPCEHRGRKSGEELSLHLDVNSRYSPVRAGRVSTSGAVLSVLPRADSPAEQQWADCRPDCRPDRRPHGGEARHRLQLAGCCRAQPDGAHRWQQQQKLRAVDGLWISTCQTGKAWSLLQLHTGVQTSTESVALSVLRQQFQLGQDIPGPENLRRGFQQTEKCYRPAASARPPPARGGRGDHQRGLSSISQNNWMADINN